jgi:hypothetical protein
MDRMPESQPPFRNIGMHRVPQEADQAGEPESEDAIDRMELANGDSLRGEVTAIHEGIITLQSPLGEISLPVARLRKVALKQENAERSKRYNGDVRAWFPDGSSIVFRLDSGNGETLRGFSQNFGNASFDAAAFNRIEFNIHSPEYQLRGGTNSW